MTLRSFDFRRQIRSGLRDDSFRKSVSVPTDEGVRRSERALASSENSLRKSAPRREKNCSHRRLGNVTCRPHAVPVKKKRFLSLSYLPDRSFPHFPLLPPPSFLPSPFSFSSLDERPKFFSIIDFSLIRDCYNL